MRKFRILLCANPEIPVPPRLYGGVERIIDILVKIYKRQGHDVGLVAHRESKTDPTELFPWKTVITRGRWDTVRRAMRLREAVTSFNPDIVHSFSHLPHLYPLLLGKTRTLIMTYSKKPPEAHIARATKFDRRGMLSYTGFSDRICKLGRSFGGDWTTVPGCVDINSYAFQPTVSADAPLVFLSRVHKEKGAHLAIETAKQAGVRLIIAGNHASEGEQGEYWRKKVEPDIGNNGIEYVGPLDDHEKSLLLGRARALIVPVQWSEPFGMVFLEALACGTPVISMHRGAIPEIIHNRVHGYLCDGLNELVESVEKIDQIDRLACRQRAETDFSAGAIAGRYLDHYIRCIEYAGC